MLANRSRRAVAAAPDPSMTGARVLWRHWQRGRETASEGWLREFSGNGRQVRICERQDPKERGRWWACREIWIEAVLNAATAPAEGGDDE